ncbi:MAG TPA: iron-sulfur cluster assembly scaffold protein [Solimonas sp.]
MTRPEQNVHAYATPIWQRFREPRHAGRLTAGPSVFTAEAGSAAVRASLRLQVKMDGPRVGQARFQAYGCPSAIAVGEWLAEQLEQQSPSTWAAIDAATIRTVLEISEDKAHCALMGEDVLRALTQTMSGPVSSKS